ncbi:MAG: hypothetical protein DRN92_06175 [Thermoproteota archaeon]|nr:MAG: hypothetical protein DRN92_06175 [Candidatus Korarchaeota archaeon]
MLRLKRLKTPITRMKLHLEFVLSRYLPLYAFVAFLAVIINAYLVIPSILNQIVASSTYSSPFGTSGPYTGTISISLTLAHLIFSLVSISLAASMAGELRSTSLFHLSQPLRRIEYSVSWLLSIAWLPSLLMALSLFVPLATFDPRLVLRVSFQPIYLRLVEDLLTFSIFCWAALSKRRGIVAFIGLFFVLILPYLTMVLMSLIFYVFYQGTNPPTLLLAAYEVLFPSTASTLFMGGIAQGVLDPMKASIGTLITLALTQGTYLIYFIRKFEVK